VVLRVRQDEPDAVVIEVADTGPGLPELVREKLFQPFVTTREKGVGLGLSIVHRLVQRHGGTVSAEERKGGGTVFRVVLPLE
jgi:signal transduction histidine kinase